MPSGRRGAGVRVVLDTNVVVSALIWGGPPERLLDLAVSGEIALFSSAVLLDELSGVLERGKFSAALASRNLTPALLTQAVRGGHDAGRTDAGGSGRAGGRRRRSRDRSGVGRASGCHRDRR